jgi:ribosomal protein L16 Arg81 hydroxylase
MQSLITSATANSRRWHVGGGRYCGLDAESHKREIKMSEYVHMVHQGGARNDYYMVSRNHFFDRPETQQLYGEVPRFPEYLDHSKGRRTVLFWFAPAGTITPLHHDQMNILIAQIRGRKRFTLISPEQTAYLYNNTSGWADVDCEQPDYSRYPLYRDVRPLRVVLQPGDVLFLPAGWWHHVKALDVSIRVSYINFKFPNQFEWVNLVEES